MFTTPKSKTILLAATGLAAAMMCAPALAQETTTTTTEPTAAEKAATAKAEAGSDEVIIVKGLRKSLQSSTDKKRKAGQISETITAEDAGKLPDNNVIEALAHVTGVQITRSHGEGDSISIRGMDDVQTTVNGSPASNGTGRSISLNDVPAELIKSVTVYKTRTADQVEGGFAGTVNVDLRRPLDLKKGWTLAGSFREVYGDIGDTKSPYTSALIAKRFDTSIGEMGFLVNLSYQENNYNEQYVQSETPQTFWGAQLTSLPADHQDAIGLYRIQYGVDSGKIRRPSLNASYQWRVNDNLDFVLEGSMFNATENRSYSAMNTRLKDSPAVLSDVVYAADGKTILSMTETDPNLTDTSVMPVGSVSRDDYNKTENNRINFEAHWHNDNTTVNLGVYKDTSSFDNQWYTTWLTLDGLASMKVDTNSSNVEGGGPYVAYYDASGNALDLSDASNYNAYFVENGKSFTDSSETAWNIDVTHRFSDDKFVRSVQFGVRKSDRELTTAYGYRYAYFNDVAVTDFPGGSDLDLVSVGVGGTNAPSWYRISRQSVLNNWDAIRAYANTPGNTWETGGSGGWADATVSTERLMSSYTSSEKTAAIYAQLNYGFKAWDFPVDGSIGGRSVHTWGQSLASQYMKSGEIVDSVRAGEGTDFMPNVNAIIHFSPKLQLRLAYTVNIQRPSFNDMNSFVYLYDTTNHYGWGGNPDLKPNEEKNYDASLEYYFGRGGILSAAVYDKKPSNFFVWGKQQNVPTDDDNDPSTPDVSYTIYRAMNGGPGEYKGIELNAQGFFDFLPSPWNNFGASANLTYNYYGKIEYAFYNGEPISAEEAATIPGIYDAPYNSKYTYNLSVYYEHDKWSARVAFNHRDRYRSALDGYSAKGYSTYFEATERLDFAVNYTPVKWMTVSLEGTNLLGDSDAATYGANSILNAGTRVGAKTVQLSARFRY
ncbi:MAG: TonB-dependent receptor [Asticcacaulis sp.]|uniref:TonB-dependent receptor n=1 Tax=Asticcacaulis sp. TaxID=1872648 RepID=UPI0039E46E00